jgi:hypothetical protein
MNINDYISKIASLAGAAGAFLSKNRRANGSSSETAAMSSKEKKILGASVAVPIAGGLAFEPTMARENKALASNTYHDKRVKKGFQASNTANVNKISKILMGKEKIKMVPGTPGASMGPTNRFMQGSAKQHISITAHELGHLSGKAGKSALWKNSQHLARQGTPVSAFAGWFTKPGGKGENLAIGASVAGTAAIVGEEARASIKGYKALKEAKFSPQTLKQGRKTLLLAGGTYAAAGAGVLLNAYLLKQRKRKK